MKNLVLNLYCVKDDLEGFMTPFPSTDDATACRGFELAVKKPESMINAHPEQFNLYCLGSFDTESGKISSDVKHIQNGSVYKVGE